MPRLLKWSIVGLLIGGLLLLLGSLIFLESRSFDNWLRAEVTEFLESRFQVEAEFGNWDLRLWSGELRLQEFVLRSRELPGEKPDLRIESLLLNFSILDYLASRIYLDELQIEGLTLRIEEHPNRKLNLSNMFRSSSSGGGGFSPLQLAIGRVELIDALVSFENRQVLFNTQSSRFELTLDLIPQRSAYLGRTRLEGIHLEVDRHRIPVSVFETYFELDDQGLHFLPAEVSFPGLSARLQGALSWKGRLDYQLTIDLQADLESLREPDLSQVVKHGLVQLVGNVDGSGSDFQVVGEVSSDRIEVYGIEISRVRGDVEIDKRGADVKSLIFKVFGGAGTADGQLCWSSEELSRFSVHAQNLKWDRVLSVLGIQSLPLGGLSAVDGEFRWPGLQVPEIVGEGQADFRGQLANREMPAIGSIPVQGQTAFLLADRNVRLSEGTLDAASAAVGFEASLGFGGDVDLQAQVSATDSVDLWTAARIFGLLPDELIQEYPVSFNGSVDADLALKKPSGEPLSINSHLRVEQVGFRDVGLGSLEGDFELSADRLAFSGFRLRGSGLDLRGTLGLQREPLALARLDVDIADLDVARLSELGYLEFDSALEARLKGRFELLPSPDGGLSGGGKILGETVTVGGQSVESIAAQFTLSGQAIRLEEVEARVLEGTIRAKGTVDLVTLEADLDVRGSQLAVSSLSMLPPEYQFDGIFEIGARLRGKLSAPMIDIDLQTPELVFGGEVLEEVGLSSRPKGAVNSVSLRARYRQQPLIVSGTVSSSSPFPFSLQASLQNLALPPLVERFGGPEFSDFDGKMSVSALLTGQLDALGQTTINASLDELWATFRQQRIEASGPVSITYRDRVITLDSAALVGPSTDLKASGRIDLKENPQLNLKLAGHSNIGFLSTLMEQGSVQGELDLETTLAGPVAAPRIVGTARLREFALAYPEVPVDFSGGQGTLRFTANQVSVEGFSARTQLGRITVSGGVFLEGFRPSRWQLNVAGSGLSFRYPRDVETVFDADIDFAGGEKSQLASGVVYIRSAEYTRDISIPQLVLLLVQADSPGRAATPSPLPLTLDIQVEAYRSIRISNNLAQVIGSGNFSVIGTVQNPVIIGSLTVDEGKLSWDGKEFELGYGTITFNNPRRIVPFFNFEAETQIREYSVSLTARGPIDQLQLSFRSEPPLAPASIVALLAAGQTEDELFGSDPSAPGRSRALVTMGAGTLLSKTLGQEVETQANRLFGFDRFSIDPFIDDNRSRDPGARITLGKQITPEIGVTYISNLSSNPREQTVVIQYRITNWLTIVGTGQDDQTLGLDFQFRKRF